MVAFILEIIIKFIRYALYLAVIGELSAQTFVMQEKAGQSVKKGLICLKCINEQLHHPKKIRKP